MTFLVVEGPDGAGKSRLQQALGEHLRARGHAPLLLREPGSTAVGEHLRRLLLDPAVGHLDALTEVFLFSAARTEMVRSVIGPALREGKVVVLDRWHWSTTAYQGGGGGVALDLIARVSDAAAAGLVPDLVLLLDVDPEVAALRRPGRDRMEARGADYAARVRAAYLDLARANPAVACVLDASRPFSAVFDAARERVDAVLARRGGRP